METQNTSDVKTVNILGSEWTVKFLDEHPSFEHAQGVTTDPTREILIENVKVDDDPLAFDLQAQYIDQKRIIRHEIIHAYLYESGLGESSNSADSWAVNEEMVDWFARMSPKIFQTFKELKCL